MAALPSASVLAEEIAWTTDVRAAWQTAQAANRPLLLFVTSSHCAYCRKMQSDTLSTPAVARRVQDSYVPVMVNADSSAGLAAQLKISGVPTTLLVLPDGRIAERVYGYVSAARLQTKLDSVVRQSQAR
jgi:protein disulfide-isomerase